MSKTYLITLTPTGKFFFGGDMTFKVEGDEDLNKQFSSYIIRSSRFPQQTSLLGMLRFLLLRKAGESVFKENKIVDTSKAKGLIGNQSFMINSDHKKGDFGKIQSISNCFIMDGDKPLPFVAKGNEYNFAFDESKKGNMNGQDLCVPTSNYDAKEGFKDQFENVFKEDWRMGIDKDYSGKTKDASLFKQIAYQFVKEEKDDNGHIIATHDYKFAFCVTVDDSLDLTKSDYDGALVSVGADSSQFILNVSEPKEAPLDCHFDNVVVLTSPSFVELNKEDNVIFAITETIPFKFMQTTIETKDYGRLSKQIKHSNRVDLYQTGSVFFFNTKEAAEKLGKKLETYADFYQIGYNHYQVK